MAFFCKVLNFSILLFLEISNSMQYAYSIVCVHKDKDQKLEIIMISDLETLVLGNARSPEHLDLVVHIDVCIVFSYDNDTAAVPILYNYSQVFQVLWDFSWILHSVTTS